MDFFFFLNLVLHRLTTLLGQPVQNIFFCLKLLTNPSGNNVYISFFFSFVTLYKQNEDSTYKMYVGYQKSVKRVCGVNL